jgi:hypothetical protein
VKDPAGTTQQCGPHIFVQQLDNQPNARQHCNEEGHPSTSQWTKHLKKPNQDDKCHKLPSKRSHVILYHGRTGCCTSEWKQKNKSSEVHPVLLNFMGKSLNNVVGEDVSTLDCYSEFHHSSGQVYHAHPNYQVIGPWYDWALVWFTNDNKVEDFPCCILCFHWNSNSGMSNLSEDGYCSINGILQATMYHHEFGTPE